MRMKTLRRRSGEDGRRLVDVSATIDGRPPIVHAAGIGSPRLLGTLIAAGASPSASDADGFTALHLATEHDHVACVEVLLKAKASMDAKSPEGLRGRKVFGARKR
jgi:ankyrin repeat protein